MWDAMDGCLMMATAIAYIMYGEAIGGGYISFNWWF